MTEKFSLTHPIFNDADKAREHLEAQRWPTARCARIAAHERAHTAIDGARAAPPRTRKAQSVRPLPVQRLPQQYTVTVGTIFERSKVPLNKWLAATYLITSSKKGVSAHQLHRTLDVTYKTAWFMLHRIREAMGETTARLARWAAKAK